jgi:hypothetical protein
MIFLSVELCLASCEECTVLVLMHKTLIIIIMLLLKYFTAKRVHCLGLGFLPLYLYA